MHHTTALASQKFILTQISTYCLPFALAPGIKEDLENDSLKKSIFVDLGVQMPLCYMDILCSGKIWVLVETSPK